MQPVGFCQGDVRQLSRVCIAVPDAQAGVGRANCDCKGQPAAGTSHPLPPSHQCLLFSNVYLCWCMKSPRHCCLPLLLLQCRLQQALCQALRDPKACGAYDDACGTNVQGVMITTWNPYNYLQPCIGALCAGPQMVPLTSYINSNKARWGVPTNVTFTLCTQLPGLDLDRSTFRVGVRVRLHLSTSRWSASHADRNTRPLRSLPAGLSKDALLPPLLDAGVRVLIMSGDLDFLCNSIGTEVGRVRCEGGGLLTVLHSAVASITKLHRFSPIPRLPLTEDAEPSDVDRRSGLGCSHGGTLVERGRCDGAHAPVWRPGVGSLQQSGPHVPSRSTGSRV